MLKLKNTPGFARDNLMRTSPYDKQVSEYGDPHGFLAPVLGATDLVLPQSQARFELPVHQLNGMITNDKFCCTRWGQLQLSWWRRPLRLRRESDTKT
jgi:hypothetical protein